MATKRHPAPAPDRLLTTTEAAARLGLTRTALWERRRRDPDWPPPQYVGERSPRWSAAALDAYVARKTQQRALRPACSRATEVVPA